MKNLENFNLDQNPPLTALQIKGLELLGDYKQNNNILESKREDVVTGLPSLSFKIELENRKMVEFTVVATSRDNFWKEAETKLKEELSKLDSSGNEDITLMDVSSSVIPLGKTEEDAIYFGTVPLKQ